MERAPTPENTAEYIPRKDEIRSVLEQHCNEYEEKRELSDEKGIYLWEVEKKGSKEGESTIYRYQRQGRFPDGIESSATTITTADYEGTTLVYGEDLAEYNPQTKTWENK